MSGDRHDMSDAEWEILRSVLPDKHQGPERVHADSGALGAPGELAEG